MKRKLEYNQSLIFEISFTNGEIFTLEESEFKSLEKQKGIWASIYKDGNKKNYFIMKVNKNNICFIRQRIEVNLSKKPPKE